MSLDLTHLGITDDQARDLIKLAAAACRSEKWQESNPLHWALDFFDNTEDLVAVGAEVWERIDDKFRPIPAAPEPAGDEPDPVMTWLEHMRDRYEPFGPRWAAMVDALQDYQLRTQTGTMPTRAQLPSPPTLTGGTA
ncbi:hypothetical protein AB0B45_02700 [Nonomuraea sp. NPDC049152]|uniref:hypothetical protein n=1 Tax=Nonomuraea sp. NPDC049152 TaxID=3154350 RepID=UPI0033C0B941